MVQMRKLRHRDLASYGETTILLPEMKGWENLQREEMARKGMEGGPPRIPKMALPTTGS